MDRQFPLAFTLCLPARPGRPCGRQGPGV